MDGPVADRCWSCRAPMNGMAVCPECGEHPNAEPGLWSKQNPGRLDFRAILILVLLVPTLIWKTITEAMAGNGQDALMFGGLGLVMLFFAGLHLYGRYARD